MKRFVFALFTVALMASTVTADAAKKKAYILIGDMKQDDYVQFWQSIAYTYGISKNSDIHDQMNQLIEAKRKEYEAKGYDVVMVDNTVSYDLKKALNDNDTDALVFFGHGVEGSLTMTDGEEITPNDIVRWRQEKYARDNGIPVNRDGSINWRELKTKYGEEQANKWGEIWKKRPSNYNINDAYFHTCFSLENNSLVDAIMSDNGDFTGFKGTGYLNQAMDKPDNIRGKPFKGKEFIDMLKKYQESSNIKIPDDAHVVVFKDEQGQTRWNISWTDDRTGKDVTLVIWSDKNGRVTGSDFRESNDMKNVLDNMGGDYKPTKSGVLLPGGGNVKWQNTPGVSLTSGTDSTKTPGEQRVAEEGWDKVYEGWDKVQPGWDKVQPGWDKVQPGWDKVYK